MKSQVSRLRSGIYGLVGRDISYTLSPLIFRRVFDELGWQSVYGVFDLPAHQLRRFVAAAADAGINGFNVTQPYKVRIMPYLDRIDPSALAVGAVNTVARQGRRWIGLNTDVHGVHQVLSPDQRRLAGTSAVIIGAGGAARAVACALADRLYVRHVTFAVRSLPKGYSIVRHLNAHAHRGCRFDVCRLARREMSERLNEASLLVNATPVGGFGHLGRSPVPRGVTLPTRLIVFDLVYNPRQTQLLREAKVAGCRRLYGGWLMLLAQAEESFHRWTGARFPSHVRNALKAMETLS